MINSSNLITVIGVIAVLSTTVQFVPQVIHAFKQKDLNGLSLPTFLMISFTASTWIIYGLLKSDWVVILANAAVLVMVVAIASRIIVMRRRP